MRARPGAAALALLLAACSETRRDAPCDGAPCTSDDAPAPLDAATDAPATDDAAADAVDAPTGTATDGTIDAARAVDVGDVGHAADATIDVVSAADAPVALDAPPPTDTPTTNDSSPTDLPATIDAPPPIDVPPRVDAPPPVDVPPRADVPPAVDAPAPTDVPRVVDASASGGCISGAIGTHVARFRWYGSSSGSRAAVSYEANTLPDPSRWRVTANSRSIGYTPVFSDPFLGEGGLELSGTAFIDVELSTAGLSRLSGVTLAVYGRSFNTTAGGSFAWRTFDGTGATPSGFVYNSAPYRWYRADASAAFVAGNGAVLLRITPGPPSGALIVNRVEVCFDAR